MWHRKRSVTGNCQTYTIQQLINGETQFVVYCLFMYALGACSVTLHALYRHGLGCIRETTSNAVVFFFFLFFWKHKDPAGLRVFGLETTGDVDLGRWLHKLCRKETHWIKTINLDHQGA